MIKLPATKRWGALLTRRETVLPGRRFLINKNKKKLIVNAVRMATMPANGAPGGPNESPNQGRAASRAQSITPKINAHCAARLFQRSLEATGESSCHNGPAMSVANGNANKNAALGN